MFNKTLALFLALVVICAVPTLALAGDGGAGNASGTAKTVSWSIGIGAIVGFIIGGIPFNRFKHGIRFDLNGAETAGLAGAFLGGGIAEMITSGLWMPGIVSAGLGTLLVGVRVVHAMRPLRRQ